MLYNFLSSDNQNQGVFLRTFSALDFSSDSISLSRNSDMESIQLEPSLIGWIRGISWCNAVRVHKSSTSITRGKSYVDDVARVAKESA